MGKYLGIRGLGIFFLITFAFFWHSAAMAVEDPTPSTAAPNKEHGPAKGETLDGVLIEAVEAYPTPRKSEVTLGAGIYPFDAYYDGIGINAGFIYHFSDEHSWQLVQGTYFFNFEKGLTSELASKYNVAPSKINRLNYLLNTSGIYSPAYGKFVFLKNYIRYFRTSALYGLGLVSTQDKTAFAVNIGFRFGVFVSDRWAWGFDVQDSCAVTTFDNYVTFNLNTGFSF